ncbi:MAG: YgfZ/GcvT domain-containing protein [Pseudomonadota bacterium]
MTDTTIDLSGLLGVLAIDGPDAATFLQGQATCDTRLVTPSRGALGALCNLQGRMIVSFHVLPSAGGLYLVMPHDRVVAVLQHLKKYAVFSKVTLHDAGPELAVSGITGAVSAEPFAMETRGDARIMQLAGNRRLILAPRGSVPAGNGDTAAWLAAGIAAGELLVDSANADKYLPQAFNYDLIDGVSFRKGCYTGQEVVARMHFKGKMKERLYHATTGVHAIPAAGAPVQDAAGRHVGDVVAAVNAGTHGALAAVLRHDAVDAGTLRLADGTSLTVLPPALSFPER